MSNRRILSLWFPRLGAERVLRAARRSDDAPLAIIAEVSNTQVITSLNVTAQTAGLHVGQPVRDAHAMCAGLLTQTRNAAAETAFLAALRRWAGKFSPWVAEEAPDGLVIDLTGCAHLFGGESELLNVIETDCADIGLSVCMGVADTLGTAWALARYAGQKATSDRNGDAIDQEARATRSRAGKRRH
ncbi:MAG: DNA polymerase Y family protein, partial [Sedimentitalea sp.]